MEARVGTGKVDVLEDALGARLGVDGLLGYGAVVGDAQNLAGADVSHVLGAHDVERAGLAGHDPALLVGQLAEAERADAARVTERVQGVLAHERHRVAALHHGHGVRYAAAQVMRLLREVADEARSHLGVGVRAEGDAQVDELHAQLVEVDQRAVMG